MGSVQSVWPLCAARISDRCQTGFIGATHPVGVVGLGAHATGGAARPPRPPRAPEGGTEGAAAEGGASCPQSNASEAQPPISRILASFQRLFMVISLILLCRVNLPRPLRAFCPVRKTAEGLDLVLALYLR